MEKKAKNAGLREIMITAWSFVKKLGMSMSEAMRLAWLNAKLKVRLQTERVTRFCFRKVDGTIRTAVGTLYAPILEEYMQGDKENGERKHNDFVQAYLDLEKMAFRSFRKANLVSMSCK